MGSRAEIGQRTRGFTLVDLLVSIAVIGVLIGILLPSLRMVHDTARKVVCASNLRQVGLGVHLYTADNDGLLMPSMFVDGSADYFGLEADPLFLRLDGASRGMLDVWDGMGWLYADDYLSDGRIFYCPAHAGEHEFEAYAERFNGVPGEIIANYQYRGEGPNGESRIHVIDESAALVSDGFREVTDINHTSGMNVLRAGMSVGWFADTENRILDIASQADGDDWDIQWDLLDGPVPVGGGFWSGAFD